MPEEFRDAIDAVSGDAIDNAVDIGAVAATAPEPERSPGKRRGRPPGAGNRAKPSGAGKEKTSHKLDLSSLTGLFVGLHVVASGALDVPELSLDMKEGEQFMSSAQNVMRHYSVESSQKTIDWLAFGGTCCMIYGTRFGAYMLRKRTEAKEHPPATVYQMPRTVTAPNNVSHAGSAPRDAAPQEQHFEVTPEFDGQE